MIFGLYHGLVLLPVLLFILGPDKTEEDDKVQSPGQEGANNNYGTRGHDNLVFVQEQVKLWIQNMKAFDKYSIQGAAGGKSYVWT